MNWKKTFLIGFLWIACFELVARLSPWFVGPQLHQKYLIEDGPAPHEAYGKTDKRWVWRTNGRGARAQVHRGQPRQVAFIGNSSFANSLLTQSDIPTQVLQDRFQNIHVDNFSRDGFGSFEARHLIGELADRGKQYDLVVISTRPSHAEEIWGDPKVRAHPYWKRWGRDRGWLKFPGLLRQQMQLEWQANDWGVWVRSVWAGAPHPRDTANRKLIAAGKVKFTDDPPDFRLPVEMVAHFEKEAALLLAQAKRLAPRVLVLSEAVAYDERQVKGVAEKWYLLYPVKGRPGYYQSIRSSAFVRRARSAILTAKAREMGLETFDLDGHLRRLLRKRADLYFDHAHFTATGARVVADLLEPEVRRLVTESAGGERHLSGRFQ